MKRYTSSEAVEYFASWGVVIDAHSLVKFFTRFKIGTKVNDRKIYTEEELDEYLSVRKDLYTIEEVADALNVSTAYIFRMVQAGMPREKHYGKHYYDIDTVFLFIQQHRQTRWKRNKT